MDTRNIPIIGQTRAGKTMSQAPTPSKAPYGHGPETRHGSNDPRIIKRHFIAQPDPPHWGGKVYSREEQDRRRENSAEACLARAYIAAAKPDIAVQARQDACGHTFEWPEDGNGRKPRPPKLKGRALTKYRRLKSAIRGANEAKLSAKPSKNKKAVSLLKSLQRLFKGSKSPTAGAVDPSTEQGRSAE